MARAIGIVTDRVGNRKKTEKLDIKNAFLEEIRTAFRQRRPQIKHADTSQVDETIADTYRLSQNQSPLDWARTVSPEEE